MAGSTPDVPQSPQTFFSAKSAGLKLTALSSLVRKIDSVLLTQIGLVIS